MDASFPSWTISEDCPGIFEKGNAPAPDRGIETLILLRLKQIHKGRKLKDGDKHDGLNLLFLIKILTANEGSYKQPHLDGLYDY